MEINVFCYSIAKVYVSLPNSSSTTKRCTSTWNPSYFMWWPLRIPRDATLWDTFQRRKIPYIIITCRVFWHCPHIKGKASVGYWLIFRICYQERKGKLEVRRSLCLTLALWLTELIGKTYFWSTFATTPNAKFPSKWVVVLKFDTTYRHILLMSSTAIGQRHLPWEKKSPYCVIIIAFSTMRKLINM